MNSRVKRHFVSTDSSGQTIVSNAPSKENFIPSYMYRAERPGEPQTNANNAHGVGQISSPAFGSRAEGSGGGDITSPQASSDDDCASVASRKRRRKKRGGFGALEFSSGIGKVKSIDEQDEGFLKLDRRADCGVCRQNFEVKSLPYTITKKAVLEQRALWGKTQLKISQLIPSALYAGVRICAFCGQFFGMERELSSALGDEAVLKSKLEREFDGCPYLKKNQQQRVRIARADYRRSLLLEARKEQEAQETNAKHAEYQARQQEHATQATHGGKVGLQHLPLALDFSLRTVTSVVTEESPMQNFADTTTSGGVGSTLESGSTSSLAASPMSKPPRPEQVTSGRAQDREGKQHLSRISSVSKSEVQPPSSVPRKTGMELRFEVERDKHRAENDSAAVSAIHRSQIEARARRQKREITIATEKKGKNNRRSSSSSSAAPNDSHLSGGWKSGGHDGSGGGDSSSISWHTPPPCRRDTKTLNSVLDKLSVKMGKQHKATLIQRQRRADNAPTLDLSSLGLLRALSTSGSLKQKERSHSRSGVF